MVTVTTLASVRDLVAAVPDPELPNVTIEELGILRDVRVEGTTLVVSITPTYSGCPAMEAIAHDIEAVLRANGWESRVETVLSPAWTTDWLSDSGRAKLRAAGVASPGELTCPRCSSERIRTISEFGSTACQAIRVCGACGEPFPYFKPHR